MFSIHLNTGVPIYRQVVDQVVRLIDLGKLQPGEMLPSVRQLATELGVNPMTISRAYSTLEADAVVERRRGVGMVVIQKPGRPNQVLAPDIQRLVQEAQQLGWTQDELVRRVRQQWKKGRGK